MSGGHFDYKNHFMNDIADELERLIKINDSKELNEFGETIGYRFPAGVLARFEVAKDMLRRVSKMVHAIDYLLCGDYGVDSFLEACDDGERESLWVKGEEPHDEIILE